MRRDTIFYQLFRQSPALLFELVSHPPQNANQYIFDSIEVKETAFRIDGVFIPPDVAGIVYFCEVQFQLDELLYERMLSEISIYTYRHRSSFSDWRAVAIYPSRSLEQSNKAVVAEMLASGRITPIYLDELATGEDLPIGLSLMLVNHPRRRSCRGEGTANDSAVSPTSRWTCHNGLNLDDYGL